MKSLQVLTPARQCIYNCPFCIARTHHHNNKFINNYEQDYAFWKNNLIDILKQNQDLKTIVITGTNEPLQDEKCIENIIELTREIRPDIQIEIQTRVYEKRNVLNDLDVVAFSISNYYFLDKVSLPNTITRYVIILTDTFNNKTLDAILEKIPKNVSQLTFKVLHDSNGYNEQIDIWVKEHRTDIKTINNLKEEINHYQDNMSIFFDESCMEAEGRYMVFREDGHLYKDFESLKNEDIVKVYRKGVN